MKFRIDILFQKTIFRYLFGVVAVATAFALRMWLDSINRNGRAIRDCFLPRFW